MVQPIRGKCLRDLFVDDQRTGDIRRTQNVLWSKRRQQPAKKQQLQRKFQPPRHFGSDTHTTTDDRDDYRLTREVELIQASCEFGASRGSILKLHYILAADDKF